MPYYAGGFFHDPKTESVLLHERDEKAPVNPNKWGFFGGLSEPEDKTPTDTFIREIKEELGLDLQPQDVRPFRDYLNVERNVHRHVFYVETDVPIASLTLGEGKGMAWIPLDRVFDYDLTDKTITDLRAFIAQQENRP